jgi:hypothetical protein
MGASWEDLINLLPPTASSSGTPGLGGFGGLGGLGGLGGVGATLGGLGSDVNNVGGSGSKITPLFETQGGRDESLPEGLEIADLPDVSVELYVHLIAV